MNKKYLNFTLILIVLSVLDVITTQYALSTYPHLSEGNPIMALVTSSFALFVLVKAVGIMVIVNIYRRIKVQSELASKIGKTAIIMMMLFVVSNNVIQIASATTTYGVYTPNTLEYPGRVGTTGSLDYAFLVVNGSTIKEFGTTASTIPNIWDNGFDNAYYTRMSGTTFVFATTDWAHPYRIFGVASNKDVFYTDTITSINFTTGYYDAGYLGCAVDGNCNDLHKIGVVTTINTRMSGFVDSEGNLYLNDGMSVIKFTRSSDFTKTTLFTASYGNNNPQITSIAMDSLENIHLLIGGQYTGNAAQHLIHQVYTGASKVAEDDLYNPGVLLNPNLYYASLLIQSNQSSPTKNIVFGYKHPTTGTVYLRYQNASGIYDICPTSCGVISSYTGMQILGGYAYIASSAENKIYRFPTTISVSSGSGYIPGVGTGATATANINYNIKTIQSMYANYYNTSQLLISVNIDADSGFNLLGNNYALNATLNPLSQWYYFDIINPDGVMVKQQAVGRCVDTWAPLNPTGRCTITGLYQFNAPSSGWQGGSWYAKLYESANGGHVALLTTSATWNVYNGSTNNNATIINPGVEPISSPSNQETIGLLDNIVGLMGFGVNSVSKFLFSLIIIVILFVVGLWKGNGNIGLALSTIPYTFFTFIEYIPKWVFIIYVIMLIVIAKVFR